MTHDQVRNRLGNLAEKIDYAVFNREPVDGCFCVAPNDEVMRYIEEAVAEKIARSQPSPTKILERLTL